MDEPARRRAGLAERLEEGDPDAYDEAFRQFHAPLVRYAQGFTRDEEAARDIVQDVFLKFWEMRNSLSVQVSLKAMLYTMVRNRSLNYSRDRKRISPDTSVAEAHRQQRKHALPPDVDVEAQALRARLHRWIEELPDRRAEAFKLSRYHDLSHEEIAEAMGIAKRTVDTHVYHALRDLRERLDNLENDECNTAR